jgi:uncharacterized protein YggU (UPF0235/DUF167 family)
MMTPEMLEEIAVKTQKEGGKASDYVRQSMEKDYEVRASKVLGKGGKMFDDSPKHVKVDKVDDDDFDDERDDSDDRSELFSASANSFNDRDS